MGTESFSRLKASSYFFCFSDRIHNQIWESQTLRELDSLLPPNSNAPDEVEEEEPIAAQQQQEEHEEQQQQHNIWEETADDIEAAFEELVENIVALDEANEPAAQAEMAPAAAAENGEDLELFVEMIDVLENPQHPAWPPTDERLLEMQNAMHQQQLAFQDVAVAAVAAQIVGAVAAQGGAAGAAPAIVAPPLYPGQIVPMEATEEEVLRHVQRIEYVAGCVCVFFCPYANYFLFFLK